MCIKRITMRCEGIILVEHALHIRWALMSIHFVRFISVCTILFCLHNLKKIFSFFFTFFRFFICLFSASLSIFICSRCWFFLLSSLSFLLFSCSFLISFSFSIFILFILDYFFICYQFHSLFLSYPFLPSLFFEMWIVSIVIIYGMTLFIYLSIYLLLFTYWLNINQK